MGTFFASLLRLIRGGLDSSALVAIVVSSTMTLAVATPMAVSAMDARDSVEEVAAIAMDDQRFPGAVTFSNEEELATEVLGSTAVPVATEEPTATPGFAGEIPLPTARPTQAAPTAVPAVVVTTPLPTATTAVVNTPVPTNTPVPRNTPVTNTPTPANTPVPPTNTPTPTNTPVPPTTPPTPTNTPVPPTTPPTPTNTPVPPTPTATPTATPANTPTPTARPTATPVIVVPPPPPPTAVPRPTRVPSRPVDLALAFTGTGTVNLGDAAQLGLVVANYGDIQATNVGITITSTNPNISSVTGPGWSCAPQGNAYWNCFRSSLPSSGSQLVVSVTPDGPGNSSLVANGASTEVDANSGNNLTSVLVQVLG